MKTELLENIQMNEYRQMAGLSKHQLDAFNVCPAYYKWRATQEFKPSRDMELGTLIHSSALEGRIEYVVAPPMDRRTKAGKEAWEAFSVENEGMVILTKDEGDRVEGAVEAVKPLLDMVFGKQIIEASMFWERGGHQCKGRPDMITEVGDVPAIVDLKTTSDIGRFDQKFFGLGYDKQAAWYTDGLAKITGETNIAFYFLVVDTQPPHLCQWVLASSEVIKNANAKLDPLLLQLKVCMDTDVWPGLPRIRTIHPRKWEVAE